KTKHNAVIFRDCSDCTLSGLHIEGTHTVEGGLLLENCRRFNISGCTILDCENAGLVARNLTNSIITGCLIRDDREGSKTPAMKIEGEGNVVANNAVGE